MRWHNAYTVLDRCRYGELSMDYKYTSEQFFISETSYHLFWLLKPMNEWCARRASAGYGSFLSEVLGEGWYVRQRISSIMQPICINGVYKYLHWR